MNPTNHSTQLEQLLDHLEIDADLSIKYDNHNWSARQRKQEQYTSLQLLQEDLSNILYSAAYVQPEKQGSNLKQTDLKWKQTQSAFLTHLSKANQSKTKLDAGWTSLTKEADGSVYAQKDKYYRHIKAGGYIHQQVGISLGMEHAEIAIPAQREGFHNSFYYAYGNVREEEAHTFAIRLYFNLIPEGCAPWINEISRVLNHYGIPFTCKCLTHPDYFDRADTAVLYLYKPDFNFAYPILERSFDSLDSYLAEAIPLFTKKIRDGIAFAESPPIASESFGTSRCKIIAEAITEAIQQQIPKEGWLEKVRDKFSQLNFDLEKLHLNPESHYSYLFTNSVKN